MNRYLKILLGLLFLIGTVPATYAQSNNAPIKLARERIVLHTSLGDIVIALYFELAPAHSRRIALLSQSGAYDSAWVNFIDPGHFVAISPVKDRHNPLTPQQSAYLSPLPFVETGLVHERGTVAMIPEGSTRDSAESALVLVTGRATPLDGKATIVGHIERGHEALDRIEKTPLDRTGVPLQDIQIIRARVVDSVEQLDRSAKEYTLPGIEYFRAMRTDPWINFFGGIFLIGLLCFVFGRKVEAYWVAPCGLLVALIGGYGIFVWINPRASGLAGLPYLAFFGMLALFRLMGQFERPRPPKD